MELELALVIFGFSFLGWVFVGVCALSARHKKLSKVVDMSDRAPDPKVAYRYIFSGPFAFRYIKNAVVSARMINREPNC